MISSTRELVQHIQPSLPADYARRDVEAQQAAIVRLKNLLQLRRNLIELVSGQQVQQGLIAQYEADAVAVLDRLTGDARAQLLPQHRRNHLSGRRDVYLAKAARAKALIEQYQLEIDLYRDMLTAGVMPSEDA